MKTYTVTLNDETETPTALREVWIAPGNESTAKGSGRASDPWRVSTPYQFDQIFRAFHTRPEGPMPMAFRLMPGRYYTQGCWAHPGFATLWAGDALIGSTDVVIAVSEPVRETNGVRRPDLHVVSAGSPYQAGEFCRVEDVTIDGGFGLGVLAKDVFVTSGLRLYGSGSRVTRVEVDGIGGSYEPVTTPSGKMPLEAFGISFETGSGGRVRDCVVRSSTLSKRYVSAFSAAPAPFDGVVFEDCVAYGREDHAGFTVYDGTVVRNCRSRGFAYGIYNDTGNARRILVDGGEFIVGRVGIGIVAVRPDEQKHGIKVRDARFSFQMVRWPIGLELISKPEWNECFQDLNIRGCRFECDEDINPFTIVSTNAPKDKLVAIKLNACIWPEPARINAPEGNAIELAINADWSGVYFEKKSGLVASPSPIIGAAL